MMLAAGAWRYQIHPEVWLLVAAVLGLGFYVSRVIAPKVPGGLITRRQRIFFWVGVVLLWIASDWPMHDIGEEYLYSVHMVQHVILTMILPPVMLLAVPSWLVELIIGSGRVGDIFRRLTRPLFAGVAFNGLVALTHWKAFVNLSSASGSFHYLLHVLLVVLAFAAWMPIVNPVVSRRLSPPFQAAYLFGMSLIPTLPAAWLTFADNAVYKVYAIPTRVFGLSVAADQQAAGVIMKVGTGFYLWTLIAVIFLRWSTANEKADRAARRQRTLTYQELEADFARTSPPTESALR